MSMDKWFFDQARLGNVYHSHNSAAKAFTAIHATNTGLTLSNPVNSGKLLVMKSAQLSITTLGVTSEVGLAVSPTMLVAIQTGTKEVVHNGLESGSDSNPGVGTVFSVATLLTTPVWLRTMGKVIMTAGVETGMNEANMDGDVIIPPGQYIGIMALTAARTGVGSFTWAEIDE